MDQITVPQFIENEDKIVGPITVRQFVLMFVAAIIIFLEYKTSDFSLFIFSAVITLGLAAVFAFYKINGQPFHFFVLHILQTLKEPSLRVWKRDFTREDMALKKKNDKIKLEDIMSGHTAETHHAMVGEHRLAELSLVVDTGGAYHGAFQKEENELF